MKTIVGSYPRSGNTWTRYCIEFMSGRRTAYHRETKVRMNDHIAECAGFEVDQEQPPIAWETHFSEAEELTIYHPWQDSLIFLVRNYKEVIIRQCMKASSEEQLAPGELWGWFTEATEGLFKPKGHDYMFDLKTYDAWMGNKILIYYEDLVRNPIIELEKIAVFMNLDLTRLKELLDHYDTHREKSVALYNQHISRSQTGGDPSKIHAHSKRVSPREIQNMENYVKLNWSRLHHLYLRRYDENV